MAAPSAEEWTVINREKFINNIICLSAFVVLYYDYFLTLPNEINRFWRHSYMVGGKIRWAHVFFYINRYGTVVGNIPVFFEYFWVSARVDKAYLELYHLWFAIGIQLASCGLMLMRVYAMYDRNRYVLGVLVIEALATTATGIWVIISAQAPGVLLYMPYVGCRQDIGPAAGITYAIAWTGLLIFDGMIFALTLYKALTSVFSCAPALRRDMLRCSARGGGLLSILLRDGTVYFASMFVVNLLNILSLLLLQRTLRGTGTIWTNVISSTMISRLMLNLRDPRIQLNLTDSDAAEDWLSTVGPILFTTPDSDEDSSSTGASGTDRDIELSTRARDTETT